MRGRFDRVVEEEFARQPLRPPGRPVVPAEFEGLPPPVRRYLARSGAVGRPRPQNFRVEFDATMYRKPGHGLPSRAVQYGFLGRPARFFFLETRMLGLRVKVLHVYAAERATMRVRVAGLFDLADAQGPALDVAETVTILNDVCVMAPAALLDARFAFEPVDERRARVSFQNGPHRVGAVLHVDPAGDLVDFESTDRHALPGDGNRWTTPLRGHRVLEGRRLPGEGDAIWHYPDGRPPMTYGRFVIRALAYDLAGPRDGAGGR